MTATPVEDLAVDDLPNLDDIVPCQSGGHDQDVEAQWRVTMKPCGHIVLLCHDCRAQLIASLHKASATMLRRILFRIYHAECMGRIKSIDSCPL